MLQKLNAFLLFAIGLPILAQSLLTPEVAEQSRHLLSLAPQTRSLNCNIRLVKPSLDYAFRFESGYRVRCSVKEFEGKASSILSLLRVTPEHGTPLLLSEEYSVPAIPVDLQRKVKLKQVDSSVEMDGRFRIGEGTYLADLVLVDDRGRRFEKRWTTCAARDRETAMVPMSMTAHTAEPAAVDAWDQSRFAFTRAGIRLAILLDATPTDKRSVRLRPADRVQLLDSLASLLRQMPCAAVRLVAFNLDQQREIIQEEGADRKAFGRLSTALGALDLSTISYRMEQHQFGWSDLLTGIANRELAYGKLPDALVFLGAMSQVSGAIPPEMLVAAERPKPPLFYFEYVPPPMIGQEIPDALDYFTVARKGTVYRIHSPVEFAAAIQSMRASLEQIEGRQFSSR